jgi:hypothetical protein
MNKFLSILMCTIVFFIEYLLGEANNHVLEIILCLEAVCLAMPTNN